MSRQPLWTLDELTAQVALALSVDYDGAASGRVRDVPDRRTIRYYTTLGLLDRPAELRGRTALYGRRHLLQLVAIKRLQARGASLVEVQQQLVGLTDTALRRLARLPAEADPAPEPAAASAERPRAFWKAQATVVADEPAERDAEPPAATPVFPEAVASLPLQGVRLDDDVSLLLVAARPLEDDDLEALRAGAAPLLKILHTRRLLRPRPERS
jgi:DNA-binding transcriptional MerR regulator